VIIPQTESSALLRRAFLKDVTADVILEI